MRSDAEIGKGCEEIGYRKGTKEYKECVEQTKKYDKLAEKDQAKKQEEEANKKFRDRWG